MFFVWELTWTQEPPPPLHCRFSVGFFPASEEQLTVPLKPYTYEFHVEDFFVCNVIGKRVVGWKHGHFMFLILLRFGGFFQYWSYSSRKVVTSEQLRQSLSRL